MRVFLDANILFSGSFPGSLLSAFLNNLKEHAVLITNQYAIAEAERNLQTKMPKGIPAFNKLLSDMELISLQIFDLEVPLAQKDEPILCGAIIGQADFLLTGDKKDFGHLFGKTVSTVRIVTVELLVAELKHMGVLTHEDV
jgi:predicted nucleic acid-binding protein